MDSQIGDRAVVLGASMAGLLAARVLTEAYGQVTVIDRDESPRHQPTDAGFPTAATSMHWGRAGSKCSRSCSRGSLRNWSKTARRPGTS